MSYDEYELICSENKFGHGVLQWLSKEPVTRSVDKGGRLLVGLDSNKRFKLINDVWVIEVFDLFEPLDCHFLLVGIEQSLIDWLQILPAAHTLNEFLCHCSCILVSQYDAEWEPSHLYLWDILMRAVQIAVNPSNDL